AEDGGLKETLQARREAAKVLQTTLLHLERDQHSLREQLADLAQRWGAEEARREECHRGLERTRIALPSDWQTRADDLAATDVQAFQGEQQSLEAAGVEARGEELAQAQANLDALRHRIVELEEETNQVPAEARTDPGELTHRRAAARKEQSCRESILLE